MSKVDQPNLILTRKVQKLGTSSLIITLPHKWVKRHGIKVGDVVFIHDEGDRLIITPKDSREDTKLQLDFNHAGVVRHAGKLGLCAYIFGFNNVVIEYSKLVKSEIKNRLQRLVEAAPGIRVTFNENYTATLTMEQVTIDVKASLAEFMRRIANFMGMLTREFKGESIKWEVFEDEYSYLLKSSYVLLRSLNTAVPETEFEEKMNKYLVFIIGLSMLIIENIYGLAIESRRLRGLMSNDELKEATKLIETIEVALSTIAFSITPPSVKKIEESYSKSNSIIKLVESLPGMIEGRSAAFSYLLGRIIDLSRMIEALENIILCNILIEKYGSFK